MHFVTSPNEVLRQTSRTFYLSLVRLPPGLREAATSSYLLFRGIDEIEDHQVLDKSAKLQLLRAISHGLSGNGRVRIDFGCYEKLLPEVSQRLEDWTDLAPKSFVFRVRETGAIMAQRMASWVSRDWRIRTQDDLDQYTFAVAGSVGLLLSELWRWHDGTTTNQRQAISFGRGLQAVNILRNRTEDLARGRDFFPRGWVERDLQLYALCNLKRADAYVEDLPAGPVKTFCGTPLMLAYATLNALRRGEGKLSRGAVLAIVGKNETQSTTDSNLISESSKHDARSGRTFTTGRRPDSLKVTSNSEPELVVLVNEKDEVIGAEEKIKCHILGKLHRAFSIFVFNSRGQLLLQKRTTTKYHSRGLWSNTCCGHPRLGESTQQASQRRLKEEMGFDCQLHEMFGFVYRTELAEGLTEHEYDHVLVGRFDGTPQPSQDEVDSWRWIDLPTLKRDLQDNPESHTDWLRIAFPMLIANPLPTEFSYLSNPTLMTASTLAD